MIRSRYPERPISRPGGERLDSDSTMSERRQFDHTILSYIVGKAETKGAGYKGESDDSESWVTANDTTVCISIDRSFLSVFAHSMLPRHGTRTHRVILLFLCP